MSSSAYTSMLKQIGYWFWDGNWSVVHCNAKHSDGDLTPMFFLIPWKARTFCFNIPLFVTEVPNPITRNLEISLWTIHL